MLLPLFFLINGQCIVFPLNNQYISAFFVILLTAVSNLALHKPAKQSSTFTWAEAGLNYSADLAVDGNNGTNFVVDKCTSTEGGDTNPWWLVDLRAIYTIKSVRIFNRGMDKWGVGKGTQ